jgi:hypothetical protein
MKFRSAHRFAKLLSGLALVCLLVSQSGLAAHVHADNFNGNDCFACHLDNNPAALETPATPDAVACATAASPSATVAAPLAVTYRKNARGPPANPC